MVTSFDYIRRKLLVDSGDGQPFGVSLLYYDIYFMCTFHIYKKRTGRFHFPFDSVNGRASSFIIGKESLSAVEKGIGLFIINAHCCWVVHFFFFLPVFSLSLLRMKAKSQEIQSTLDPREEKVRLRRLILIGELGIKVNRLPHTHADRDKNILKTSAVSLFCNMKFIEFPFFFVGLFEFLGSSDVSLDSGDSNRSVILLFDDS